MAETGDRTRCLRPVLFAIVALAAACGTSNGGDLAAPPSPTSEPTPTTIVASESSTVDAEFDDVASPARTQLDWIVTVLNDGAQVTDAEIDERFSPAFLAEVPADQLAAFFPQLLDLAGPPFTVERFEPGDDGLLAPATAVLLGADGRRLSVEIVVAPAAPNLIEGLLITPTDLEFPLPIDIAAIDERLSQLGPQSSLGLYEVTSGDCTAVHEIRTDSPIVLGSVFKLWVLAALGVEIDEGRASWDETMTVTDELRSNPVGDIYQLETGTEVTLKRLAEAMISISDNTATDMLLDRLGRPAVEAILKQIGVADPAANVPMLSTGNLFALKYVADPPNASDYRALDEDGRRAMLADLDEAVFAWTRSETAVEDVTGSVNVDGLTIDQPRDLDIEWFATAEDLCRTLVHLSELADIPGLEPLASILEINPGGGLPFDRDRWPTIRFKGGSEAGVVAGAWWFERIDGDRYVLAGGVANPDDAIDMVDALLPIASAIELIE